MAALFPKILPFALIVVAGCADSSRKIAQGAIEAREQATAIHTRSTENVEKSAGLEGREDVPEDARIVAGEIRVNAEGNAKDALSIQKAASSISENVAGVENKKPVALSYLQAAVALGGLIAAGVAIYYFWPVLLSIRSVLGLVPRATKQQARVDAKVSRGKMSEREAVAAKRAANPLYDREFRKTTKKMENGYG